MARRSRKAFGSRWLQQSLNAITRSAMRAGQQALKQALRNTPKRMPALPMPALPKPTRVRRASVKPQAPATPGWTSGVAIGPTGARRYRLYKPPGIRRSERVPLLVMLHGCDQDAAALAESSGMNRLAARERVLVLYPEQDRLSNAHGCWNWFDTRSGRAQREAASIDAAIEQVCLLQPVDRSRIAIAGLSAGASMAALLATLRPGRFRAVAMHSGVAPGIAHSSATVLSAMRGRRKSMLALPTTAITTAWPALLVVQGSADRIVAVENGVEAVRLWAQRAGASRATSRVVQRGSRRAVTITDHRAGGRIVATLCVVEGLGHAWSGGAANRSYSDPSGPDATRMIWRFCAREFARAGVS
jgi:poly(hydroxyalkanoate) depolymerase family esterase